MKENKVPEEEEKIISSNKEMVMTVANFIVKCLENEGVNMFLEYLEKKTFIL